MPGNTIRDLSYHLRYGSIAPQHRFELEDGYNVFIGKNDAGKTTFLQWVFRCLYEIQEISKDSFSLILSNRNLISPHTRTTLTLGDFNSNLYQQISTTPLLNDQDRVDGAVDLYSALLQNQNFMEQLVSINEYLARMGFKPIEIKQQQIAYMDNIPLHQHGSGIRHIVSILSALTSSNIGIVLIDEPEVALEARAQKVLKEIFTEASETKTILVASQSHLFIEKTTGQIDKNYIVTKGDSVSLIQRLRSTEELIDLTFNLLGNSLEDLFFPSNFLIVEGSSDQVICERVQTLLDIDQNKVKIIAARGIDNISSSYVSMVNTLIPVTMKTSPYAKRIVVLIDQPNETNIPQVKAIKCQLKKRCFLLNSQSLEEYIPEQLYIKANRDKNADLKKLSELYSLRNTISGLNPYRQMKKEISDSIASVLSTEDLVKIPEITNAVKLSFAKA